MADGGIHLLESLEEIYHFKGGNPIQARLEKPLVLLRFVIPQNSLCAVIRTKFFKIRNSSDDLRLGGHIL
jgi:hypothetical protein